MAEKNENTIAILRAEADNAAAEVVKAMNEHRSKKEIDKLKKTCTEKKDAYNNAIAKRYYMDCAAKYGKNAVLEMIRVEESAIPDVIKYTYKVDDNDVASYEVKDDLIKIDLTEVQATIGKEYFHATDWFARLSTLARLISVQVNKDIAGSEVYKYVIDKAAEEFQLGEDANPTSKNSMTKCFQKVVDGIVWVGDDDKNAIKFESNNWCFIRESMTRKGKRNNEMLVNSPANTLIDVVDEINKILNKRQNVLKTA